MNGPEFFMRYAGRHLVGPETLTGDAVVDCDMVLTISHQLNTGKTLRLSSCWMIITPSGVTTSFKAMPSTGFDTTTDKKTAKLKALKSGEPCMLLELGKRSTAARDLFVTYDPRAVRVCQQGQSKTTDFTKDPAWTS